MGFLKEDAGSKRLQAIVDEIKPTMQCNCDLDNWEPERDSGHSWVCRIHKAAKSRYTNECSAAGKGDS
jgi:hypothetical protein